MPQDGTYASLPYGRHRLIGTTSAAGHAAKRAERNDTMPAEGKRHMRFGKIIKKTSRLAVVAGLSLSFAVGGLFAMPATAEAVTLSQAKSQLTQISDEYDKLEKELEEASDKLEETKGQIEQTEASIMQKQEELETAQSQLSSNMSVNYKEGETTMLDVLVNADSLEDLTSGMYYYNRANDVKAEQIADVQQVQSELQQQQSDLKAQQEQQQQTLDETQKKVDEAEKKQDEAEKLVNSLEAKAAAEVRAAMSASLREATSSSTKSSKPANLPSAGSNAVVSVAQQYLGIPYVYGGNTPSSGFDCSGYVRWVLNQSGVGTGVVGNARSTGSMIAYARSAGTWRTDFENMKAGDVLFTSSGHVTVAAGGGMMYHSPAPGRVTCYASIYSYYGYISI